MRKLICLFGFLLMFLLNLLMLGIIYSKNKNISFLNFTILETNKLIEYANSKAEHYSKVVSWLQKANQILLSPEFEIRNEAGDTIQISNLLDGNPKLVFRYTELSCNICVDSQLVYVKKFIKKHGALNIIMLSNYKYSKTIYQFKTLNKINNEIYNTEVLDLSLDQINIPYYFILNVECKPEMFFVPDKILPEDTEKYFQDIEKKYFDRNE